ncbi:MAG: adenylate kinase [Chloroflexota bacterium]|nr:MAG: adenylate kinase [Chloroflexota bacterium]
MGGPGAGKGTQARRLESELGLPQVSTGDLFRHNIKNETELGKLAQRYIDAGDLVPDEVTVAMVRERLSKEDCANGALLDGFPRTVAQAEVLDELLAEKGARIGVVPFIRVDADILLERLAGRWTCTQCGHVFHLLFKPPKSEGICDYDSSPLYQREDDTEETQKRRIDVYFEMTAPLLNYYRERGLLAEVNGEQSIDEVQQALASTIREAGCASIK